LQLDNQHRAWIHRESRKEVWQKISIEIDKKLPTSQTLTSAKSPGIKYPLPKMDMLAIPDFSAGAMENYGCVTYRETAILWDPAKSAASAKQRVACE